MNTFNHIVARNSIYKCNFEKNKTAKLINEIDNFQSLEEFFTYLIIQQNAKILCLPHDYRNNKEFIKKLINKKPQILNDIFKNDYEMYVKVMPELNLSKIFKRIKFPFENTIKQDIKQILGETEDFDINSLINAPKPDKN